MNVFGKKRLLAGAVLTAAMMNQAMAQVPPDIADKIAAMGRRVDPMATARIYAPLQQVMPVPGVTVKRDLAYGTDPKEKLDLFTADIAHSARPIVIFVHGGAFRFDDKSRTPDGRLSPFYDNVMLWSVAHGMVGINMNYPLAPKATYPAVQHDIAEVVAWARKNAVAIGGDPDKIIVWGHSAGAAHVASFLAHPEIYADVSDASKPIAGAVLSSGIYDLKDRSVNVYFGPPELAEKRASVEGIVRSTVPVFVASAEFDPDEMSNQATLLDTALNQAHRDHGRMIARQHGHMSEIYAINTKDVSVSDPILDFIDRYTK